VPFPEVPFPEPTAPAGSRAEVFLRYLDYFRSHDLGEVGQPGDRWDGADPATLERILFHLLQEYARHLGHLDIVVELATGRSEELFSAERAVARAPRTPEN